MHDIEEGFDLSLVFLFLCFLIAKKDVIIIRNGINWEYRQDNLKKIIKTVWGLDSKTIIVVLGESLS
jgi:hypothetical protein